MFFLIFALTLVTISVVFDILTFRVRSIVGEPGGVGVTGIPGITGAKGSLGVIGFVGDFGPTGPLGVTGPTGSQGTVGPTGNLGFIGPTGPTGVGVIQGPPGPTGFTGVVQTGATGPSSSITGPQGPTGIYPSSTPVPSLGISYGGFLSSLGQSIPISFAPTVSIAPAQFPVIGKFAYGPYVSNEGGNSPALIQANTKYSISAFVMGNLGTSQPGAISASMTCRITLTATSVGSNFVALTIGQPLNVAIAQTPGTNVFALNAFLTAEYTTTNDVPVLLGFGATFQCSGLTNGSGFLTISPATLLVSPII